MSFIGSMLGQNGTGGNFKAQQAPVSSPVTPQQIQASIAEANNSVQAQRAFMEALAAQGGIQNQSSVFNQQQGLANQLQGMTEGQGPNPAQAALAQATGNNISQQAALMAGQRGAGANAGLMARQAAQQGAGIQQNSVGQAATMQAQQQLNAINALQAQQGQMAGLSTNQVGQQANATSGYMQGAQNQQNAILGAQFQTQQQALQNASQANQANATIQAGNQKGQQGILGSATNAIGGALSSLFAQGGMVKGYEEGGVVQPSSAPMKQETPSSGPKHGFTKSLMSKLMPKSDNATMDKMDEMSKLESMPSLKGMEPQAAMSQGGKVPVLLSPGEKVLEPGKRKLKEVPGKAKVKGDSEVNDTYRTSLAEGAIVVPRTKAKDPKKAMAFINAVLAKQNLKKK